MFLTVLNVLPLHHLLQLMSLVMTQHPPSTHEMHFYMSCWYKENIRRTSTCRYRVYYNRKQYKITTQAWSLLSHLWTMTYDGRKNDAVIYAQRQHLASNFLMPRMQNDPLKKWRKSRCNINHIRINQPNQQQFFVSHHNKIVFCFKLLHKCFYKFNAFVNETINNIVVVTSSIIQLFLGTAVLM